MTQNCKNCTFMEVKPGTRITYKAYGCCCPLPEVLQQLPDSITKVFNFHWPPSRNKVWPDGGENCPRYTKLEKVT